MITKYITKREIIPISYKEQKAVDYIAIKQTVAYFKNLFKGNAVSFSSIARFSLQVLKEEFHFKSNKSGSIFLVASIRGQSKVTCPTPGCGAMLLEFFRLTGRTSFVRRWRRFCGGFLACERSGKPVSWRNIHYSNSWGDDSKVLAGIKTSFSSF